MYGAMQMPEDKVGSRESRKSTYETTVVAKSAPVAIRYAEGHVKEEASKQAAK